MEETPLASVAQLAAFLQEPISGTDASAELLLEYASAIVRGYLQQTINRVTADVVYLDPSERGVAFLPELPVTEVSKVETFDGSVWSVAAPGTYTVSKRTGTVSALGGVGVSWPSGAETWRVTYSHGFDLVPDPIIAVVLGVAARAYASGAGVESERIGGYQVKYGSNELTPMERAALDRYRVGRVA